MGLFWDKLKAMFKKETIVEFSDQVIDEYIESGGGTTSKQSAAPAQLVAVGFGPEYDNKLAIRKTKSQRRNWKRWKNRV